MEFELEYVENGKYFNILNKWEIDPSVERLPYYDRKSKRIVILLIRKKSLRSMPSMATASNGALKLAITSRGKQIFSAFWPTRTMI